MTTKQETYKRNQADKGLVQVTVYVHKGDEDLVKEYAKSLREFREEEEENL